MTQIRRSGPRQGRPDTEHPLPLSIPPALHEQVEWEGQWQYAAGWADGYAAGWQAVADEVARAVGVRPYTAKAVIQWLCRSIDLDQRKPEPYSSSANGTELGVAERELFGRLSA